MDIERFEKIRKQKIKTGVKTRAVRDGLKEYEHAKRDQYEGISHLYKPLIDAEESVKKPLTKNRMN